MLRPANAAFSRRNWSFGTLQDYIAVVNNDCCLAEGDVYDLCVPETVTSPTADRADGKGHGAGLFPDLEEAQEYGIIDNVIAHR